MILFILFAIEVAPISTDNVDILSSFPIDINTSFIFSMNSLPNITIKHDYLIGDKTWTFHSLRLNHTKQFMEIKVNATGSGYVFETNFQPIVNNAQLIINNESYGRIRLNLNEQNDDHFNVSTISKFPINLYDTFNITIESYKMLTMNISVHDKLETISNSGFFSNIYMNGSCAYTVNNNIHSYVFKIRFKTIANLKLLKVGSLEYIIQIYLPVQLDIQITKRHRKTVTCLGNYSTKLKHNLSKFLDASKNEYGKYFFHMSKNILNKSATCVSMHRKKSLKFELDEIRISKNLLKYNKHIGLTEYKFNVSKALGYYYSALIVPSVEITTEIDVLRINFTQCGFYNLILSIENNVENSTIYKNYYFAIYDNTFNVVLDPKKIEVDQDLHCTTNTVSRLYFLKWVCQYGTHSIDLEKIENFKKKVNNRSDEVDKLNSKLLDTLHINETYPNYMRINYMLKDIVLSCYCAGSNIDEKFYPHLDSYPEQKHKVKYESIISDEYYQFQEIHRMESFLYVIYMVVGVMMFVMVFLILSAYEINQHNNDTYVRLLQQTFCVTSYTRHKKASVLKEFYVDTNIKENRVIIKIINERFNLMKIIKRIILHQQSELFSCVDDDRREHLFKQICILFTLIDQRESCPFQDMIEENPLMSTRSRYISAKFSTPITWNLENSVGRSCIHFSTVLRTSIALKSVNRSGYQNEVEDIKRNMRYISSEINKQKCKGSLESLYSDVSVKDKSYYLKMFDSKKVKNLTMDRNTVLTSDGIMKVMAKDPSKQPNRLLRWYDKKKYEKRNEPGYIQTKQKTDTKVHTKRKRRERDLGQYRNENRETLKYFKETKKRKSRDTNSKTKSTTTSKTKSVDTNSKTKSTTTPSKTKSIDTLRSMDTNSKATITNSKATNTSRDKINRWHTINTNPYLTERVNSETTDGTTKDLDSIITIDKKKHRRQRVNTSSQIRKTVQDVDREKKIVIYDEPHQQKKTLIDGEMLTRFNASLYTEQNKFKALHAKREKFDILKDLYHTAGESNKRDEKYNEPKRSPKTLLEGRTRKIGKTPDEPYIHSVYKREEKNLDPKKSLKSLPETKDRMTAKAPDEQYHFNIFKREEKKNEQKKPTRTLLEVIKRNTQKTPQPYNYDMFSKKEKNNDPIADEPYRFDLFKRDDNNDETIADEPHHLNLFKRGEKKYDPKKPSTTLLEVIKRNTQKTADEPYRFDLFKRDDNDETITDEPHHLNLFKREEKNYDPKKASRTLLETIKQNTRKTHQPYNYDLFIKKENNNDPKKSPKSHSETKEFMTPKTADEPYNFDLFKRDNDETKKASRTLLETIKQNTRKTPQPYNYDMFSKKEKNNDPTADEPYRFDLFKRDDNNDETAVDGHYRLTLFKREVKRHDPYGLGAERKHRTKRVPNSAEMRFFGTENKKKTTKKRRTSKDIQAWYKGVEAEMKSNMKKVDDISSSAYNMDDNAKKRISSIMNDNDLIFNESYSDEEDLQALFQTRSRNLSLEARVKERLRMD